MHEILYKIAGMLEQDVKIQIAINLHYGNIGSNEKKIADAGELFTYYVANDQNDAIYDYPINNAIQQKSKYKRKKKKKRKKKTKNFGNGEKNI